MSGRKISLLLTLVLLVTLLLPVNVMAEESVSESRAERIATGDAGTSVSDAVGLETDDEGSYYEVSFYKKKSSDTYTHYVYRINKRSGDIVRKNNRDYDVISRSKAENIALDDAGYDKDDVHSLDADLDEDDGDLVWNVSFTVDRDKDYYYDDYYYGSYYYPYGYGSGYYYAGDYYGGDYYVDGGYYYDGDYYYGGTYYYSPRYSGRRYRDRDDYYWEDRDYSYTINAINEHIIDRDKDRD